MRKTIFVLGAGSGLGNAVAEKFAQNGFGVVLVSRNENNLARYKREFASKGYTVFTKAADVSDFANFNCAVNELVKDYSTPDVLFFNVGVTAADSEHTITPQLMLDRYKIDVVSAYNCITLINTKEFQEKKGCILLTGGGLALNPYFGYLPLSMDKAALRAMVQAYSPVLEKQGVHLATVQVTGTIGSNEHFSPKAIAEKYWELYENRGVHEIIY